MRFENSFGSYNYYAASDECGRGPLAGPVVACSVGVLSEELNQYLEALELMGVSDSKKLSPKKIALIIEQLNLNLDEFSVSGKYRTIQSARFVNLDIAIYVNTNVYIDQYNILVASLDAMKNSFVRLKNRKPKTYKTIWLVDGPFNPMKKKYYNLDINPVVKGDTKSILIGLSSIIAKYFRDKMMSRYDEAYPGYGFEAHKGYLTKLHLDAIKSLGHCDIHRKSFKGVIHD